MLDRIFFGSRIIAIIFSDLNSGALPRLCFGTTGCHARAEGCLLFFTDLTCKAEVESLNQSGAIDVESLASSIAQFVGGFIAGLLVTESVGGEVLDPKLALDTAIGGFQALGWAGVGFGVVFILLSFLVRGWAHTDKPVRTDAGAETAAS